MIVQLRASDAFGYHSKEQLATKFVGFAWAMKSERGISIPTAEKREKALQTFSRPKLIKEIVTVTGYIPVIGTIVGIAKMILLRYFEFKITKDKERARLNNNSLEVARFEHYLTATRSFRTGLLVRSWIEMASLGFLFLIPDLIVTVGRCIHYK